MIESKSCIIDFFITSCCTLRCKLCAVGIPYFQHPHHVSVADAARQLDAFFEVWDEADRLNFIGGEPMLHPQLYEIALEVLRHKDRIHSLRITTNGTVLPDERAIKLLSGCDIPFTVVISNYGSLSRKFIELQELLARYDISVRIDNYSSEDGGLYYGGWVDFGDYTYMNYDEKEVWRVWKECSCLKQHFYHLDEGKVFQCPYPYQFYNRKGIIPEPGEYLDLFDESMSLEEKKQIAKGFFQKPMSACKYCHSLNEKNSKRYPPAEQLKK